MGKKQAQLIVSVVLLGLLFFWGVWTRDEASKAGSALLSKLSLYSTEQIIHHLNGLDGEILPVFTSQDGRVRHRVRFRSAYRSRTRCELDLWLESGSLVDVVIGGGIFANLDYCWRQANVLIRRLRTDYRARWPGRRDAASSVLTGERP